jgi:hypothetical protein
MTEKLIGVTRIASGWRIGLLSDVKQLLEEGRNNKLKIGDKVAYYRNDKGEIIVRMV